MTTTTKHTYGWRERRAEFDDDATEPGKFFAFAWNEKTGERCEFQFGDADCARNFCFAAIYPEHINHARVWARALRTLDDVESEVRRCLARRHKKSMGEARDRKFIAGFATGYRNAERGIRPVKFPGDNLDWTYGFIEGRNLQIVIAGTDARLQGRTLANIRAFGNSADAYDAIRADCFAFLRVLDEHLQAKHTSDDAQGIPGKTWDACGDLGRLRENLRAECSAFGLIHFPDEF